MRDTKTIQLPSGGGRYTIRLDGFSQNKTYVHHSKHQVWLSG
nr:MAG TPA: hypothetical protein [Caudoviricetes sp.]